METKDEGTGEKYHKMRMIALSRKVEEKRSKNGHKNPQTVKQSSSQTAREVRAFESSSE
jgi:hypothetical protein